MRKHIDQQLRQNDCGISAIKTICNLLDINIGRTVIEDEVHLNADGASLGAINQFLKKYGFSTKFKLLDINSINDNYQELKTYFPCIMPIKAQQGLHYVVIKEISGDKFTILDSTEVKAYKLSVQELKKKAYFSSSFADYPDLEDALKIQLREALAEKNIQLPNNLSNAEVIIWFNKLTYFSYLNENFGFASKNKAVLFLKDLLFNQELQHIPEHFRSLSLKDYAKIEIKAPILLCVQKASTTQDAPIESTNIYWRLFKEISDFRTLWYIFLATMVISSIISYVSVFINQILIDHIIPSYNLNLLYIFAIGVGTFYLIKTLFRIYRKFVSIHLSNALNRFFLQAFDAKLNRFSIQYLQSFKRGDLTERLSDSMKLKSFFTSSFVSMLVSAFTGLISLTLLFIINWQLTLFTLVVLAAFIIIFYVFTPIIERLEKERYSKKAEYFSRFIEKIDGIQVIKTMNLEAHSSQQIHRRIDDLIAVYTKSKYVGLANTVLTSLIVSFASLIILVFTSKEMIVNSSISLGMILTFMALTGKVFSSFESLLEDNLKLQEYKVILQRFFDFEEFKVEKTDNEKGQSQPSSTNLPPLKVKDFKLEAVTLRHIAFSYDKEQPVLKDINLKINQGQKIWIEGNNGTGKSTLCKILGLLYEPDKGDILLNDIHVGLYDRTQLRKKILYVSGDDMIFNETLLFNISFGRPIDIKQLIEYAKVLNFYEFINEKPDKLSFMIHENGKNLSTGQKKKLLLLRAFMSRAELIIFDEIFNGIDKQSKKNAETILDFMSDLSIIIISHIPSENINFHKKYRLINGVLSKTST